MISVLASYPPSFCSFCEVATLYDGWSMGAMTGLVEFYCNDCGKIKDQETIPLKDIKDDNLYKEILGMLIEVFDETE